LEILLLLADNERPWKSSEILQKVQSSQASVEQRLAALKTSKFVVEDSAGVFRFAPEDQKIRESIHALAETYRERRVRIIEAIYSRKTDSVQTFADAFRFKRKD